MGLFDTFKKGLNKTSEFFSKNFTKIAASSGKFDDDMLDELELEYFLKMLKCGRSLEAIINDFASRTGLEDVKDFAEIFSLAKRGGGNFNDIIARTVRIMKEKEETKRDIEVMLSGKKYEQKIMNVIPIGIVLYLRFSSGGFLDVLYHNGLGIAIMTICLLIYILSYAISERIINIHV